MVRRIIAALLLSATLACTTLRPVGTPQDYVVAKAPSFVMVTTDAGDRKLVEGPELYGDTLVGFVNGVFEEHPLNSLRGIEARQPSPGRTALLAGGLVTSVALVFLVAREASGTSDFPPNPDEGEDGIEGRVTRW